MPARSPTRPAASKSPPRPHGGLMQNVAMRPNEINRRAAASQNGRIRRQSESPPAPSKRTLLTPAARRVAPAEVPGLAARRIAADILDNVLRRRRPLDAELDADAHPGLAALADRDRALVRKLVATVLRRLGTLRHLIGKFLDRGFPTDAPRVETVLLIGAAQILFLDVPDHAAVDLSVRLVQADRRAARYPGLINAVLRRIAREGPALVAELDSVPLDTPAWLFERWRKTFGDDTARAIAFAHENEPPLDLTVKSDAESWAQRLRGRMLPTGSVRTATQGQVSLLPGYSSASGGCRTPPPRSRRACSATSPGGTSPISAPRPAARPHSWRRPARASPRSTVRPTGSRACARIWRASAFRPRRSRPTPPNGRAARSTPC